MHNRLGVWALPFHVLISLTGAFLGLTTIIVGVLGMAMFNGDTAKVYALFLPEPEIEDPRPAPVMDLKPMFAQIPHGNTKVDYVIVEHPTEMGGAVMFNVRHPNKLAGTDTYAFNRSGKIYHQEKAAENNLGEDILASTGTLHFGWFGGGVTKIVYALLGLSLTYLAASGVNIWLARRRDKGRPAPRWERAWTATTWGQPAAIAAAALTTVITGTVETAILAWGLVALGFYIAAIQYGAATLSLAGRLMAGALLIVTGLAHGIGHSTSEDPVVWAVNAVLLLLGVALIATTRKQWQKSANSA